MVVSHLRIHLLWGSAVLVLAMALGMALFGDCQRLSGSDKPGSTVPGPQRAELGLEDDLAAQLAAPGVVQPVPESRADFPERLAQAIGLTTFEMATGAGGPVRIGKMTLVGGGELSPVEVGFARPAIHTQAWLWHHPEGAGRLVVLLHGHNTTARGALGLAGDDYMHGIGRDFFDWGADVLAFELSNDGVVSGYINARLSLVGGQLYGLWVKSVCAGASEIASRQGYDEIVLYGMSNGGFIADQVSVLCDGFDLVIVDDILADLPAHAAANTNLLFQHQQYAIYFLTPFLATLDYLDFLRHARTRKVYTRTRAYFNENLQRTILEAFTSGPLVKDSPLSVVFKENADHEPERELLRAIMEGNLATLRGLSLHPRDG